MCASCCAACSICFEELDLDRKELQGLSEDARHFITALLVKDPLMRPSATEALRHPFLKGTSSERSAGQSIDQSVVQRIQVGFLLPGRAAAAVAGGKGHSPVLGIHPAGHEQQRAGCRQGP